MPAVAGCYRAPPDISCLYIFFLLFLYILNILKIMQPYTYTNKPQHQSSSAGGLGITPKSSLTGG